MFFMIVLHFEPHESEAALNHRPAAVWEDSNLTRFVGNTAVIMQHRRDMVHNKGGESPCAKAIQTTELLQKWLLSPKTFHLTFSFTAYFLRNLEKRSRFFLSEDHRISEAGKDPWRPAGLSRAQSRVS